MVVVVGGVACAILLISRCAINNNEQWETAVNGRRAGWRAECRGQEGPCKRTAAAAGAGYSADRRPVVKDVLSAAIDTRKPTSCSVSPGSGGCG